jgi:hypothetical protein
VDESRQVVLADLGPASGGGQECVGDGRSPVNRAKITLYMW